MKSNPLMQFKETEIGKIPSYWEIVKLDDVCDKISDGSHMSPKEVKFSSKKIATIKNMTEEGFTLDSCKKISEHDFNELVRNGCHPEEGDVLFSKDGTMGLTFVSENYPDLVLLSSIAIIRTSDKLNSHFLHYYLKNEKIKNFLISGHSSGSALPRIVLKDLKNLPVSLPPILEQNKISSILQNLDVKIKNLKKQNKIMEHISKLIFKSWFVDFDGQKKFIDSKLGPIPNGWHVGSLNEITNIGSGKRPKTKSKKRTSEYSTPCYGSSKIEGYVKDPLFKNPLFITGRVGTIGKINVSLTPCFASDNTLTIVTLDELFFEYVFFCLKKIDFHSFNRGTSQPLIVQSDLKNYLIIIPSKKIIEIFNTITKQFFIKIDKNKFLINNLIEIRDSLSSKLMSGEIRV